MCYEFDWYQSRRAEEARKELERQERERLGLLGRLFLRRAAADESRELGDLGAPATVPALLVHEREVHQRAAGAGAPAPCPATFSFQRSSSSTA